MEFGWISYNYNMLLVIIVIFVCFLLPYTTAMGWFLWLVNCAMTVRFIFPRLLWAQWLCSVLLLEREILTSGGWQGISFPVLSSELLTDNLRTRHMVNKVSVSHKTQTHYHIRNSRPVGFISGSRAFFPSMLYIIFTCTRIPVEVRFSAPVQTGPGVHPAFYTTAKAAGAWR
jgi:hypothetical protein